MAFLIQLMLPLYDNEGRPFSREQSARVRLELTEQFGGVTAFTLSPAVGIWEDAEGRTHRDDVVVVEVMAKSLDREWWNVYAVELAARFKQEVVVARAIEFESLSHL